VFGSVRRCGGAPRPTLGSLRVSTAAQELEKAKAALLSLANDRDLGKVPGLEETVSGRGSWRQRQLAEVLAHAQKGDTILSRELSRLGRSMLEGMEMLSMAVARGSTLDAVQGGWTLERSRQSTSLAMALAMAAASEARLAPGSTQQWIAHRDQTTAANLHHWLKHRGSQNPRIGDPRAGATRGRGRMLGECTDRCWNKPTSAYDTVQCAGSPRGDKSA
jgi:Resolvase, N terminal domain